uniref:Diphthine--ammonia ligase n=1 Tax=Trypanosoma congolense (strain IL3000) TaxID=1068625 RepID=G0UZ31_TRYCI|nr:putative ATP-binding protein [Trypanosoma congolense IL3000]
MKTIGVISGGKDSILSILLARRYGHEPVVLANIAPACDGHSSSVHEIDSYSFQTVGHEVVEHIASCIGLPLRRGYIRAGQAKVQLLNYTIERDDDDEVEALYRLLRSVKEEFPEVTGVTTGAILSDYQRHRVEDVCRRLKLRSLAFLWRRPAMEILEMAKALRVHAILVKTATIGLEPRKHLGMTLEDARPALVSAQNSYGVHAAGEGGEFETIVLDCPLFRERRIEVTELQPVIVDDNEYSPSGHAVLKVIEREKTQEEKALDSKTLDELAAMVFPSDEMEHLPSTGRLLRSGLPICHDVKVSGVDTVGDGERFWGCPHAVHQVSVALGDTEQEFLLVDVLFHIAEGAREHGDTVFFLLVRSPCMEYYGAFCRAFSQAFPDVCPPGCSFVVMKNLTVFHIEVLTAPTDGICRSTMVVHSTSCWGAPSMGPYSLSNMVTINGSRRVLVCGSIGLVPATQKLAVTSDMTDLRSFSALECSNLLGVGEESVRNFIAQFAFMYANGANGTTYFKVHPTEVTHATFFLTDMRFAPLLDPLWRWCTEGQGRNSKLVLWTESTADDPISGDVVYRIFQVSQLLCDASVEIILERREAATTWNKLLEEMQCNCTCFTPLFFFVCRG